MELIFRGAYYRKEFCLFEWVGLDNKNSLKQLALTVHGLIFGKAYYWKDFCFRDFGDGGGGLVSGKASVFWGGGACYWNFAVF